MKKLIINNSQKFRLKIYFLSLLILIGIMFVIKIGEINGHPVFDINGDFQNWVTLVIEIGIGVFIAMTILMYSNSQQHETTTIIKKMNDIIEKQRLDKESKRNYGLKKIKLLATLAKEQFTIEDYDEAKETFDEIITTLNILSDALGTSESQQILELSEIGKEFCKQNGTYSIRSEQTLPFTTSIPANKAALFGKFDDVIMLLTNSNN